MQSKQANKSEVRQRKIVCPACGAIYRTSQHWIDQGLPRCQCGGQMIDAREVVTPVPQSKMPVEPEALRRITELERLLADLARRLGQAGGVDPAQRALERYLLADKTVGADHEMTKQLKSEYDSAAARTANHFPALQRMDPVCDLCKGQGVEPYYNTPCVRCGGSGRVKQR